MSKRCKSPKKTRTSDDSKEVATNEYEIESILYDETFGSKTFYLVKWKNYPMDQCTWEPYRNLTNCEDIFNEYISNKIFPKNVKNSDEYKKLYEHLILHTEQELLELLQITFIEGQPKIDEHHVLGTIGYLSTLSPNNRNEELMKVIRHNLIYLEVEKKRNKQKEKLEKWQKCLNISCGFKITVVNEVDFEGPPKKFIYVNEYVPGEGVTIPNDPPVWCHCGSECGGNSHKGKSCHFNDCPVPYNKKKRIVVAPGTPIFECNNKCTCDNSCINRVVQHGPDKNLKLQIFRTKNNRGWGVKTLTALKQGTYINKYSGEVITRLEADRRATTHGSKSTYMFDLDYNTDKNDCVYSVDATKFGNISHFINHSCEANLSIYAVWIDCYDTNIPTLALFTSRNIEEGEELTFNYMTSVSNSVNRIKCKCETKKCRGYLC